MKLVLLIALFVALIVAQQGTGTGTGTGTANLQAPGTGTGMGTGTGTGTQLENTRLNCVMNCMYRVEWNRIGNVFTQCLFRPTCLQEQLSLIIEQNRPCMKTCLDDNFQPVQGTGTGTGTATGTGIQQPVQGTGTAPQQPIQGTGTGTAPPQGTGTQ